MEDLEIVKTRSPHRKLTQKHRYEEYFEVAYDFLLHPDITKGQAEDIPD